MGKTKELLIALRNKGACWHSQRKYYNILREVKPLITSEEYRDLCIAHSHYENGEGADEFYEICNKLIEKYQ